MPEKYVHRGPLPLLVRHTGITTLPEAPPPTGEGPAIVCLHDAGLQSSVFNGLLSALGRRAWALAFDLPGHGRSGRLDSLPSIEAMAEMARWVTDWCRAERPILVGHGMGALVALEWARTPGRDVAGLLLCGLGASLDIPNEAIETMRRVTRGKIPRPFDPGRIANPSDPDLMKRAYLEGIQTDPRATLVDLEASRAWAEAFEDRSDGKSVSCPVRIVLGAAEPEAARRRAGSLASALPAATTTTIEGAAHLLPLERPRALANEIREMARAA